MADIYDGGYDGCDTFQIEIDNSILFYSKPV